VTTRSLLPSLRLALRLARGAALALAAPAARAAAQHPDTLVVATYAYPGVDRVGAIAPLASHLAARLRRPTRAVALPDPVALADAVRGGRVDVAVTNTFGYLLVAGGERPAGAAVATFRVPSGVRTNYGAVLVARDTTLRTVADLAARAPSLRVALVAPGSTTGNLVPRLFLATRGLADLERQAREVRYGGTHAAAFALLRDGAADVAALATEEYERQAAADAAAGGPARWRVLWQSPDVALGPVLVRATLPAALRSAVAAAVVGLETTAPAAFAALRGGWTEARTADALVAATDRSYDPVRRLFGADGAAAALIARFAR
jgi:phosphonate transport system substrate-binding protein